jgi:hypothetical protein
MYLINALANGRVFEILSSWLKGPVDKITVNIATFSVHYVTKHLKKNDAFSGAGNFLYGILCPCLLDMPQAQENFGLRPHHGLLRRNQIAPFEVRWKTLKNCYLTV